MAKTNAVRILEKEKVSFELIEYSLSDGLVDGISVAEKLGQPVSTVFKTLVTIGGPRELFVFLVPVALELDMEKAARVVGVKKLDMLPLKELTKETGYVRGGCSAVGMKRKYPTVINQTATLLNQITVSAGKPGVQMKIAPEALAEVTNAIFKDIVKS